VAEQQMLNGYSRVRYVDGGLVVLVDFGCGCVLS